MSDADDTKIGERARELLTARAAELDPETRRRLTQARHAALDALPGRSRPYWRFAANGLAVTVIATWLAWVWWLMPQDPPRPALAEHALADLDLLVAESPDFYVDLEFYQWLAESKHAS